MKKWGQTLVGLAIGLAMVWLLFRDTNWAEVGEAIRGIDLKWLAIAQVPLWLSFPIRVQRWTYIVRVDRPAKYRHLFAATQIGFLANFVLPARAGEAIRALVLNRLTGIPFFKAFSMVAVDRLTDIFALITVMFIAILAYQPQADVVIPASTFSTGADIVFSVAQYKTGAIGTGLFLAAIVAAFAILYINRNLILKISDAIAGLVSKKLAAWLHEAIDHFADGLQVLRSPAAMARATACSMLVWGSTVIFLYCITRAFIPEFPWYLPFVMQAILSVFIAVPGAPGFVGQFHVPIVITLVMLLPDINVDHAKAAAIIFHLLQLPPIAILGVGSLLTSNIGLLQIQKEAVEAKEHAGADDAG